MLAAKRTVILKHPNGIMKRHSIILARFLAGLTLVFILCVVSQRMTAPTELPTQGEANAPPHLTATTQSLPRSSSIETVFTYDTDKAVIAYRNIELSSQTFDLVAIDLNAKTYVRRDGALGRPQRWCWDGTTLYGASSDPAYLLKFDGSAVQILGGLPQNHIQSIVAGDDGNIYMGMYPNGGLARYDPVAGTITDLGRADDTTSITQYLYTLEVDTDYAWAGMGENPWYLVRYALLDGTGTIYFGGGASTDIGGGVHRTTDGTAIYYDRVTSDGVHHWYLLTGGIPTEAKAEDVPALQPWFSSGGVTLIPNDPNWDFDLSEASAYASHDPVVRWRPASSDRAYSSISATGVKLANARLTQLANLFSDSYLYTPADLYAGFWKISDDLSASTFLGATPYNIYDMAVAPSGKVIIGAYPSALFEWDPESAWTLNNGTSDLTASNPKLVLTAPKYPYFVAVGGAGLYYTFSQRTRDSTGGELSWYNPADGTHGSLRPPLVEWTPRGMCWCAGKIILSGNSIGTPVRDGTIFVIDPTTHTVEDTWTIPGAVDGGAITAVSSTDIVGIVNGTTFAYRLNVLTGSLVWTVTLPYKAWGSLPYTRRRIFNDGKRLWFTMNHAVYSLSPTDGSTTKLADSDGDYNVLIKNGDAYTSYGASVHQYVLP